MKTSPRRVQKEDYSRILLTETSTYDVPIIFSNTGFYWQWRKYSEGKSLFPELMDKLFKTKDLHDYSIPFSYKSRKNSQSQRDLNLMHPRSQINFIEFYKNFDFQILLACQKSRFSIRFPGKIGQKYYIKNKNEKKYKFKSGEPTSTDYESKSKYLSSYFSYRSHTRLHKFFESPDFRSLEKKYNIFWSIDVARCFDSIYTHSITWALKNKTFAKKNIVNNTFGAVFDRLMQNSNYNETNGIIIGSEVSRIFSEIIFQDIDQNVFQNLSMLGLIEGEHYTIRRYVDDMFIFSISDTIARQISSVISEEIKKYKLSLNENKTIHSVRPFITKQSYSIRLIKESYQNLLAKLLKKRDGEDVSSWVPNEIYRRSAVLGTYLEEVKMACYGSPENYDLVAGYLIAIFSNLLTRFSNTSLENGINSEIEKSRFTNFYFIILEIIFHLYTISPGQNSSIKLAISINSSCIFFDKLIPQESNSIRSLIYTLAIDFFQSSSFFERSKNSDNSTTLESLNILAALKILGPKFMVSSRILDNIINFSGEEKRNYFEIVTLLYYLGDNNEPMYRSMKKNIRAQIDRILNDLSDIRRNSEKFYLLLDIFTCPFLEEKYLKKHSRTLWKHIFLKESTEDELNEFHSKLTRYSWFTSWSTTEIVNNLEKKALLNAY